MSENEILRVENVGLHFGGITALQDVSFELHNHEILGLIGPNGAGKTCIVNSITRFYKPQHGEIYFKGKPISKVKDYNISRIGISRTFQDIELYTGLTALENIMAPMQALDKSNILADFLYFGWSQKKDIKHREEAERIIDFLEMQAIRNEVVGLLPYGLRKRVELGRALAHKPKLLLLDEPMAGMTSDEKEDMARFIIDVYEHEKISILLIEHDMGVVMDITDRIVVMDFGVVIKEGSPDEVKKDPQVIKAYLGKQ